MLNPVRKFTAYQIKILILRLFYNALSI